MERKKKNLKKQKGITLIALVITIIVLLILAAISISTLTGDNGILTKARIASEDTKKQAAKEKVQMEVLASYGTDGKIDVNQLNDNLAKIEGLKYKNQAISDNNKITETDLKNESGVKVTVDGYEVIIYGNGTVKNESIDEDKPEEVDEITSFKNKIESNPEGYLQKAKSMGQTSEEAIGIGTDGEVVDLDLWNYFLTNDGKGISLGDSESSSLASGYKGDYTNGEIKGKMPQYIYFLKTKEIFPTVKAGRLFSNFNYNVNDGSYEFIDNTELMYAPELPKTLKVLGDYGNGSFFRCLRLQEVRIPESVTSIGYKAFGGCTSIMEITIPNSVINMSSEVFEGWTSSQTIHVPFKEGQEPSGWLNDWNQSCSAQIVYEK